MKAEILNDPSQISSVEVPWRGFAEARGNMFITPEWFRASIAHLDDREPLIVAVSMGEVLIGLMPLVRSSKGNRIRFAGSAMGDRFSPATTENHDVSVAVATINVLDRQMAGSKLILSRVDIGQEWPNAMSVGADRKLTIVTQQVAPEPFIALDGLDWDGYLAQRNSKFRKRIRYIERALERDHAVQVQTSQDPATLDADLDDFFSLHDLRWGERGGSSIATPDRRAFIRSFAVSALARGWLRLRFLEVDGHRVSTLLGWNIGGRYAFYQGGFDPRWAKQSVGMLLVAMTIRDATLEDAAEFDFLLGNEDYKRRFATDHRTVQTSVIVGSRRAARVAVSAEALARGWADGIKNPALRRLGKRFLPNG